MVVSRYAQTAMQIAECSDEINCKEVIRRMKLISSEAERLSLLVGQILDVTRIEEGHMSISKIPCHVDEIIYEAIETYYPILNKNPNSLEICIHGELSVVNADPVRISQMIVNLISNAIGFTINGTVIVSAQEKNFCIVVNVTDNSIGISDEELPFIFERYNNKQKYRSSNGISCLNLSDYGKEMKAMGAKNNTVRKLRNKCLILWTIITIVVLLYKNYNNIYVFKIKNNKLISANELNKEDKIYKKQFSESYNTADSEKITDEDTYENKDKNTDNDDISDKIDLVNIMENNINFRNL